MKKMQHRLLACGMAVLFILAGCTEVREAPDESDGTSTVEVEPTQPTEPERFTFSEEEGEVFLRNARMLANSGLALNSWEKILPVDYEAAALLALLRLEQKGTLTGFYHQDTKTYRVPADQLEAELNLSVEMDVAAFRRDSGFYQAGSDVYELEYNKEEPRFDAINPEADWPEQDHQVWRFDVADLDGKVLYHVTAQLRVENGEYRILSCQVKNMDYFGYCVGLDGSDPLPGFYFSELEELDTYERFLIALHTIEWERYQYEDWTEGWKDFTVIPQDALEYALKLRLGDGVSLDFTSIVSYDAAARTVTLNDPGDAAEVSPLQPILREEIRDGERVTLIIDYTYGDPKAENPTIVTGRVFELYAPEEGAFQLLSMNTIIS